MKGICAPFEGKKITVMGLGLLGRGVGDVEFLAACGAKVLVTDKKTEAELAESVARLKKYPNVSFHLGGHRIEDFAPLASGCDMVLKAAGVPLDSPYIAAARAAGVEVAMSTALFAKYAMEAGATIVGVTGTRGKSTVAHMIFHALQKAGTSAHLGGNIRGKSTLAMLPEMKTGDFAVLELDSWQLQGLGELKISPHIAVFTNLMPDHQNYYPDMDAYFADKMNIFRYQKSDDILFVGKSIVERVNAARPVVAPQVPPTIPIDWKLNIIGEHNRENASLAVGALRVLGLSESEIKSGVESFEPVEGRLQLVRELNGIKIYNDNNATTPEATIAALHSLGNDVVLITGGSDKGLDMRDLVSEIPKFCKAVFLLAGTGTARLKEEFPGAEVFDALGPALAAAFAAASAGDCILFSPAFASFGMFKNEYDRNDQFVAAVKQLS
jgi:UDP-N-acetylmuramoylalanine--D-glutamate ligase